jgi:hypothetical protein
MTDKGEPPQERGAQQREAANLRWAAVGHSLFPCEPGEKPEPIAWINVRRYGPNGPVDHQRCWPAVELQGEDEVYAYFGGGVYELIARKAMPNGMPGPIVRKRRLTLEGESKPFVGEAQARAAGGLEEPAPRAAAAPDASAAIFALLAEERRDRRADEQRREERDAARAAQSTQLLVQGLQIAATLVTAILNKPSPPAPDVAATFTAGIDAAIRLIPKPDAADPLDRVTKILEVADKVRPAPAQKGESVGELMAGLGQAMTGFAQVEAARIEAARAGVPPSPLEAPPKAALEAAAVVAAPPPPPADAGPPLPLANGWHPPYEPPDVRGLDSERGASLDE